MTKEECIQQIEVICSEYKYGQLSSSEVHQAISYYINNISMEQSDGFNQWYGKDKFPENCKEVLACMDEDQIYIIAKYEEGQWFESSEGVSLKRRVTHWMPLPALTKKTS